MFFKGKLFIFIKLLEIYWFYWNYWKIPILSLECCTIWCICRKNKVFNEILQIYQIFQYIAVPIDVLHWKITGIFKIIRFSWKIYHFKALFTSNAMKLKVFIIIKVKNHVFLSFQCIWCSFQIYCFSQTGYRLFDLKIYDSVCKRPNWPLSVFHWKCYWSQSKYPYMISNKEQWKIFR